MDHPIDRACLTCAPGSLPVNVSVDNEPWHGARFANTEKEIPDWFQTQGIYSSLPPRFTCDQRFHQPLTLYQPKGDHTTTIRLSLEGLNLPPNAVLGYWAAHPSTLSGSVPTAADAYGEFDNSGIVQCDEGTCEFTLKFPGKYAVKGQTFNPHFHFAVWEGDRWGMRAKTVEFVPPA